MDKDEPPKNPLPYTVRFVVISSDGQTAESAAEPQARTSGKSAGEEGLGKEDAQSGAGDEGNADGSEGGEAGAQRQPAPGSASFFASKMRKLSQLVRLKDSPPDGELGLELRARKDVEMAVKLMGSEGYYDGTAEMSITGAETGKASVVITMRPGTIYTVGEITVNYLPDLLLPERLPGRSEEIFPRTSLPGVPAGSPATAKKVLTSVDAIPDTMHDNAFPDAKIKESYFYLDRQKRTVNAIIDVEPGRPATIGDPVFKGNTTVNSEYLRKLIGWQPGVTLWKQEEVDDYVSRLRATGLFRKVAAARVAGRTGGGDISQQDIDITMEEAAHRSVSAAVNYSTDTGFGVNGEWEHRNLFGNAEKLNIKVPYSMTDRGVKADFTKPLFFSDKNTLHLWGETMYETTDAYERQGVRLNATIQRSWNRYFSTETGLFADTGYLDNNEEDMQGYSVYGLYLKGMLDTRDDKMNPTRGTVTELTIAPMSGEYNDSFTAFSKELRISGYWAPFKKPDGSNDDKLVLAARAGVGSMSGADLTDLPSTYRYYMGGASTVRGYGYQQVGPMDDSGDPVGGRSYENINLESRFKVTDDLGFVVFLDGAELYTDDTPQFEMDMDWGAGAGIRYFTPIGPLRFDVAFPLKEADPPVQIYISIGQAF